MMYFRVVSQIYLIDCHMGELPADMLKEVSTNQALPKTYDFRYRNSAPICGYIKLEVRCCTSSI